LLLLVALLWVLCRWVVKPQAYEKCKDITYMEARRLSRGKPTLSSYLAAKGLTTPFGESTSQRTNS